MVVIRLSRVGRLKYAVYRIVAADKRRAATSKNLDVLGTYNPHTKSLNIDKEKVAKYLNNGAQPSDRVIRLLQNEGIELPKWAKPHDKFKKPKKEEDIEATNEVAAEVAEEASEKAEEAQKSVDDAETAATEEELAKNQKEATENVAKALDKQDKEDK